MVGGLPNKSIWNIDYEDLVFGEVIGKGNFGLVFRGNYLGVEVAIKQIPSFDDPDYCKYTEREVKALRYIRHPYIVHFFGACHHSSGFYLITEYVPDQDLRRYIKSVAASSKPARWPTRISIALSIAKTFLFLHSKNILHRDLKSKNVLLEFGKRGGSITTKLCDFGFTRIGSQYSAGDDSSSSEEDDNPPSEEDVYTHNGNGKPAKNRLRRMSICGTISFMAPEVLLQQKYDWSVDVYSFGIILAELITFKRPGKDFWVRNPVNRFDIDVEELKKFAPKDTAPEFIDLCLKCCEFQSSQRPKFSHIISILENIRLPEPNGISNSLSNSDLSTIINLSKRLNQSTDSGEPKDNVLTLAGIAQFKERKRQSINDIFQNKFSLRASNGPVATAVERECIIKFYNAGWKSSLINIDMNSENVWVVYKSLEDKIEMSVARIQKSIKNSLYLMINDNNMVNGVEILSVKPYAKEFPHVVPMDEGSQISRISVEDMEIQEKRNSLGLSLQSLAKAFLIRKRYQEFLSNWEESQADQRKQWISLSAQLIQSELEYKKQLDLVLKSYLDPLKSRFRMNKPLLNIKELNAIFSTIELIDEVSSEFVKMIQAIQEDQFYTSTHTLSEFILRYASQIKAIYGTYTFNFNYAMNILTWCKQNPDFQSFLDRVKSQFKTQAEESDLTSLLSVPINRVQKYQLVIEKLLQATPPAHYEHKNLLTCFALVKDSSAHIQNQLELSLEYSQIMSIEIMLLNYKSTLIQNGRWFIKQGSFEDSSKKREYYIFLMSDVCIISKPVKSKSTLDSNGNKKFYYRIRHMVPLKEETISMKLDLDRPNGIILSIPNKTYKFTLSNEEEASDWLHEFERTLILVYRNQTVDHSKSLEDIFNHNGIMIPLNINNNNDSTPHNTPKFEKGFIKRFRQSISGGNSPDRRASLLNLKDPTNNGPQLKSTMSVANFSINHSTSANSSNNNTPVLTSTNNSFTNNNDKKGKFKNFANKLKRLSVTFSTSPINNDKKKELSRE